MFSSKLNSQGEFILSVTSVSFESSVVIYIELKFLKKTKTKKTLPTSRRSNYSTYQILKDIIIFIVLCFMFFLL